MVKINMLLKRITKKGLRLYRRQEENWLGRQIIKNSTHAAPDFMIIGVAKAGTTSLFQYLAQHPKITPCKRKEVKYFGMQNQPKGLRWYLNNFPTKEKSKNKLTFDATPTYLSIDRTPPLISNVLPDIKFIALLRDPVKRAYSQWTWQQPHSHIKSRNLLDKRSFEQAAKEEINNPDSFPLHLQYLTRGLYAQQLKIWYRFFNPDQFLLLDFKRFKENTKETLKCITQFLGIKNIYPDFIKSNEKRYGVNGRKLDKNEGKLKSYNSNIYKEKLNSKTEKKLRLYFQPYDRELKELTGRSFGWME
jgi:hypothetical protein